MLWAIFRVRPHPLFELSFGGGLRGGHFPFALELRVRAQAVRPDRAALDFTILYRLAPRLRGAPWQTSRLVVTCGVTFRV